MTPESSIVPSPGPGPHRSRGMCGGARRLAGRRGASPLGEARRPMATRVRVGVNVSRSIGCDATGQRRSGLGRSTTGVVRADELGLGDMGNAHQGGWRAADGRWRPGSPPPGWERSSDGRWLAPLVLDGDALPVRKPIPPDAMTTLVSPLRAPRRPPTGAVPAVDWVSPSTPPAAARGPRPGTPAVPPTGPLTVRPASSDGRGTAPPPPVGAVPAPPATPDGSGSPPSPPAGPLTVRPASSRGRGTAPPPPAGAVPAPPATPD